MKWIGQHIVDFIARFRSDVYMQGLEEISDPGHVVTIDSHTGKLSYLDTPSGGGGGGDITGVTITTDSGGGASAASDTEGSADFSILGTAGVGVTNSGVTITATAVPGEIDHDSLQNRRAAEHVDWAGASAGTIHASNYSNTTYSVQDGELSQNNFTNDDHTKLDGIEASATADQSNAEIRTAVEAATDSNVFTDADHTKLNGIEASATADQSNAEIRTAVEAATDSNVFTDADHTKLNGIEASATADQTQADINGLAITTVGALGSGTIADGFGDIDNGASTLDTGVLTAASLVCTAGATFGGGFGTTGATISTNGAIATDSTLTSTGLFISGSAAYGGYARFSEGTNNGSNYIALRAPSAVTTNATLYLPDGAGSANQVLKTDGAGNLSWTGMSGGTVGWHGSGTRIKILHRDFIPDDGGRPAMIDDIGVLSEELFLESHSSNKLYATVAIPTGYTATHVMIYGSATDAVEVWEHQINSKTGVSKGTGNVDTEINITDVASSTTNYLFIQVANASGNEVHGGYITIAES